MYNDILKNVPPKISRTNLGEFWDSADEVTPKCFHNQFILNYPGNSSYILLSFALYIRSIKLS